MHYCDVPYFSKIKADYVQQMRAIMQEYYESRKPNGFYVLGHCDFHARNMMFKHNEDGGVEDVMLLDFQISNICPVTTDIIYSVYMLMGPEERHNNYKELLDYYFSEFLVTLQKIGYKGEFPSLMEFWKIISQHKIYGKYLLQMLYI